MTSETKHPEKVSIKIKAPKSIVAMLREAAAIKGVDVATFIVDAGAEKARRVIRDHAAIELSRQGQKELVEALSSLGSPTEAMKALMELPDLPTRK